MNTNFWKILTLILGAFLVLSLAGNVILLLRSADSGGKTSDNNISVSLENSLAEPVSANDIYPLFACPCCGQSIAKECCGMAKERKAFIDGLISTGSSSEDEVVLTYVKKYGLNSFTKEGEQKQAEVREILIAEAPADRPIISLSPETYDLGAVSQQQGTVTTFFEIKNEGKSDLIINRLDSSCGCTSASIVYQGQEGPRFYMAGHGEENPTDWQLVIPPGQTGQLKVYYDPDVHPDFRGSATREISVFSNDPIDFEKSVQIELNQVD